MKKILKLASFVGVFAFQSLSAQIYLTENFEGAFSGNPSAPLGWTQSRVVVLGDGIPDAGGSGEKDWEKITSTSTLAVWSSTWTIGIFPNAAVSGSNICSINDFGFGSSTNALGTRRMLSPTINLAASTNPYVRFWLFCGSSSNYANLRVIASNDGGVTWLPIMTVPPNADVTTFSSATPWQRINVKIPAAFKVANAKFGFELTNTWGGSNYHLDDFSVEEFTPTTITSAASGEWSNPATWVGGVVPNANNDVIIAATHTVQTDVNIARMQNITISGTFQYFSTSTTQLNHIFGNITTSVGGTYFSGNGTTGKRTYFGGNIVNNGVIDFQPGTSVAGALIWLGYTQTYSGTGSIANARIPIVAQCSGSSVSYLATFGISNFLGLYYGVMQSNSNVTLGNAPASTTFTTERYLGSIPNTPPVVNTTNITQHNMVYTNPLNAINHGIYMAYAPVNLTPADEIPTISSNKWVTGSLIINTYNNISLAYPLTVGTLTGTTQNLSLSRGIITTSTLNLLTLYPSAIGALGSNPTTFTSTGVNGGNHGSYVNGPLKIIFPAIGSGTRTFPLGQGNSFHTNLPSTNIKREVVLGSGALAWNSQTITATIENAPSGVVNAPVTIAMGARAFRLNMNGGPGLGVNNTVQLPFCNSTFGGGDNLVGSLQDVRVIQSSSLTGPWTERSLTAGTGVITSNTGYTRMTTSITPGPINNGNEYFAFGSTGLATDMSSANFITPITALCFVYPNPNTGLFTIELNNGSVKNIQVMDLTGRIILSNTTSNDTIDFNINSLANGVYYVKIQSNNTVEVVKIVKQ